MNNNKKIFYRVVGKKRKYELFAMDVEDNKELDDQ